MRYFVVILSLISLFSCSNFKSEKEITSLKIDKVFEDSLSIRAIIPQDENKVWFAANNGKIGLISDKTPKLATIKYEDSLLHFRSIARTKEAVFVLSISNPAVLYKIGYKDNTATTIEEVYVEKGEKVFYDAMAFFDDKNGIAMGDPITNCLSIIITKDGGNTWTKIPCSKLPKTTTGEAAFAASNSNIAIIENKVWIVSGGKRARVFHSPNMGESWEVYDTPIIQGGSMTGIYSVDFFNSEKGVIFGGNWEEKNFNNANKAVTNDGGKTWKLVSDGKGPGYRSCVKFVPGTGGEGLVAVGSGGVSYSPDFGKSWNQLSEEGFYTLEFVNDTLGFAAGKNKISRLIFN